MLVGEVALHFYRSKLGGCAACAHFPHPTCLHACAAREGEEPPCELSGGHTWPDVSLLRCAALRHAAPCCGMACRALLWHGRLCCAAPLQVPGRNDFSICVHLLTQSQVVSDSLTLHRIASALRKRRFDGGALRLDNTRLFFKLDGDGNPCDYGVYEQASFFILFSFCKGQRVQFC